MLANHEAGSTVANSLSKQAFLKSEQAIVLREQLEAMVEDPVYNTRSIYSTIGNDGSDFVQRHMNYMGGFPTMNHLQYIQNLKLKTKIRTK